MKMNILEMVLFSLATLLLIFQDQIFDLTSYFDVVQDTHIIGLVLLVFVMFLHKRRYKNTHSCCRKLKEFIVKKC